MRRFKDQSGIALFMVIAAMSILAVLVTEFTYIAQVNSKIAYDGADQVKAHYLAKTGFKLSLLRLKAYQHVKGVVSSMGGGSGAGASAVPKQLIEQIWSFPFMYPIPTNLPGMMPADKERIEEFTNQSGLQGSFSASIESESGKFNLNLVLAPFAPKTTSSDTGKESKSKSKSKSTSKSKTDSSDSKSTSTTFNVDAARESLSRFLFDLINSKFETDPEFADEYRDLRVEDLTDTILTWVDRTYEPRGPGRELEHPKQAPFYSLSELHMLPGIDDKLFDLLSKSLTVSPTPGLNVNTINSATLRALVPGMTEDEAKLFFEYRDSTEEDNQFKAADGFFTYLRENVAAFTRDEEEVKRFQQSLQQRGIRIVTDEESFKITVLAQVNQATRMIEAWVNIDQQSSKTGNGQTGSKDSETDEDEEASPPPFSGNAATRTRQAPQAGLKVTFMRVL